MALQCTQIAFAVSIRCEKSSVAPYRTSFSPKLGLQSSDGSLQARFVRHCFTRDTTSTQLRQRSSSTVCVRAREPKPTWVEMTPIAGEAQFDEALESENPVIIDWMAAWCRKCIYLKPKLEKLAAEYHPDVKFYFVDVNTVPATLVSRAGVTKMPTIQLWKNKEKKSELIAGDQAWLVMEKIREMLSDKQK